MFVVEDGKQRHCVETKAGEGEGADYYIINFSGDNGYVIVGADETYGEVIGYETHGKIGKREEMKEAEKYVFELIDNYVKVRRDYYRQNKDMLAKETGKSIFQSMTQREKDSLISIGEYDKEGNMIKTKSFRDDNCDYDFRNRRRTEEDILEKHDTGVLLKTEWSQDGMYNDNVTTTCEGAEQALVGCVAVAVGQIMTYHKKPSNIKGRDMHWDDMQSSIEIDFLNDIGKKDIQYLLWRLGGNDLLKMEYGCNVSSAYDDYAVETFRELGYERAVMERYSYDLVFNNLIDKKPLYIGGGKKGTNKGHAWVLDGYRSEKRKVTEYVLDYCVNREYVDMINFEAKDEYVHNNFGWGVGSSGWLSIGVFNASQVVWWCKECNFDQNVIIITNIY